MAKKDRRRLTYLIKLWQVRCGGKTAWRGSLEDAHSGEKRGFGDPAGLFAFLQERLRPGAPEPAEAQLSPSSMSEKQKE